MLKKITFVILSSMLLLAGEFSLDTSKSQVYYEAKKDQFFSTYTILGTNKGLKGTLEKADYGYKGELSIDVLSFDSDDERRDKNVEEYLNAKKHKLMTFIYEINNNQAMGTMTINGVSKEMVFPVNIKEDDSSLAIDGNITIKYTDFNVETPSNFILSAHEDLTIGAKLYFSK
ncbi:YceI family protein [Sulfurimonas sp.]|uniref:YceI family protein n=1 Tax=Sulfurimonas sp. TaxID=2022749 RepID=UPI002AAFBFA7|nr:YceI family protein [Sulfurimonas sp.]